MYRCAHYETLYCCANIRKISTVAVRHKKTAERRVEEGRHNSDYNPEGKQRGRADKDHSSGPRESADGYYHRYRAQESACQKQQPYDAEGVPYNSKDGEPHNYYYQQRYEKAAGTVFGELSSSFRC